MIIFQVFSYVVDMVVQDGNGFIFVGKCVDIFG